MLYAWQSVQVTNEKSDHKGRAGRVVEHKKDGAKVRVQLDETSEYADEEVEFPEADLKVL